MALTIDALPVPVPSSTDPGSFSQRGDATFGAFPNLISQTNALASEQAANRDIVIASKVATEIAEDNAANYALAASVSEANSLASSSAQLWVSGGSYNSGTVVYSPITGSTYRRISTGSGTTDPSVDSANWYPVVLDASTNYADVFPSLSFDFTNRTTLDPRLVFERNSIGTYYDGISQAKADENLLVYSQDFSNSVWTKTSGTITANSFAAPASTTTASTFTASSSNATILQTYTADGISQYTFSLYIYRKTGSGTVSITANAGTTWANQSITAGWNRFSVTATPASGASSVGILLSTSGNEVYVWGAQLEQRSSSTQYIPTTTQPITSYVPVLKTAGNNQIRFDYNPLTKESLGVLIETSRQNILTYSNTFSNAIWVKGNSSVVSASAVSPDGSINASKLVENTANTNHQLLQNISCTAGTTYSASVYLKAAERAFAIVLLASTAFDTNALSVNLLTGQSSVTQGSFTDYSVTDVGAGWYRVSISKTASSTANGQFDIRPAVGLTWDDRSYLGNGFSGILVYGAQVEVGPCSSSYIPTTTTAVQRQADNLYSQGSGISKWFNPSEGTLQADFVSYNTATGANYGVMGISSGMFSNGISLFTGNGSVGIFTVQNTTSQAYIQRTGITRLQKTKLSGSYKVDSFSSSLNGQATSTDTSGSLPTGLNILHIGRLATVVPQLDGWIQKVVYYPKKLSDQQVQVITTK